MEKLTIKEIAQLAGVSKATVSRVLNGRPGVSPKTREKVEEIIRMYSYRPSPLARGLSSQKTGVIALVISHPAARLFAHPFLLEFLPGISHVLEENGFRLVLSIPETEERCEIVCQRIVQEKLAEGVVMLGVRRNDPRLPWLSKNHLPVVTVGRPLGYIGISFVDVDNHGGARLATEHLIQLGYKQILFINGPKEHTAAIAREEGYRAAMRAHNLKADVVYGDFSYISGYQAVKERWRKGRRVTAVFAASDMAAIGACMAFKEMGVKVGAEAAVVGFDDIPHASFFDPPLTTVRQPIRELGKEAGRLILHILEGGASESVVLPTVLVVRESTPGKLDSR
ncbi:MAG: LacI family DNA-binding transcriptional regulator [Candidatus Bipolaricaulaceae bacterium]